VHGLEPARSPFYVLRLYITGTRPRSTAAVAAVHTLCERYLDGRCDLQIIDVYASPARAVEQQVFAVPTLVREQPAPLRRLIGDLSDIPKVLRELDLAVPEEGPA